MPFLSLVDLGGPKDVVARGRLFVDVQSPGRVATYYRLAHVAGDLPFAQWLHVTAQTFQVPWWLIGGNQQPDFQTAALEVAYDDMGVTEVAQAAVHVSQRVSGPSVPAQPATHVPGTGYLARFQFSDPLEWRVQQYNDTAPAGNNFVPLDWSPVVDASGNPTGQGYGWSTERTRAVDVGETPDDIIAAHVYARWVTPSINLWDFGPNTTRMVAKLSGVDLDLKGGAAYFAVLCTHPDGKRGRYHLYAPNRKLNIGTGVGDWQEKSIVFPSGSNPDWVCSYAADGVGIPNLPTGPSFAIEALEIVIRDFTAPPTGQLLIKELAIPQ